MQTIGQNTEHDVSKDNDSDAEHSSTSIESESSDEDSSSSSDESSENQPKKKAQTKVKRTVNLSQRRAEIQKDQKCEKDLPLPNEVKPEDIQDILDAYDLPAFPDFKNMGPSTVFSQDEENQMMSYLADRSNMGIGRTREEFQCDVQLYYQRKPDDEKDDKAHVFGNILYINLITNVC